MNLQNSGLQKPDFYCCRSNAAEILSLSMLDNAYENYIENILELDRKLKLLPTLESIKIYLYALKRWLLSDSMNWLLASLSALLRTMVARLRGRSDASVPLPAAIESTASPLG